MDFVQILMPALALMTLMVLTHTYLGLHVLERGIIFVDLAVAQVAALGMSIAFLAGLDAHGVAAQLFAVAATLAAAVGLAFLRRARDKTTREVAIGCVYVVATALAIVMLSRTNQGMEELKGLLNGNVIWVRWQEVGIMFVVYSALGCLYFLLHERFLSLSTNHGSQKGRFGWEFTFFASFAVVITLAVNLAGVLLVFASLIIPAFSASFLTETFKKRLMLGWLLGWLGALGGLIVSYEADLPTGSSIVCALSVLPVLALAMRGIKRRNKAALPRSPGVT